MGGSPVMRGGVSQNNQVPSPMNMSNAKFQNVEKPQSLQHSSVYKMTPQGSFLNQQSQPPFQNSS
jgi:hypothetical protein